MAEDWIFYYDYNNCIGCHACSVSCKQFHNVEATKDDWRSVEHVESGSGNEFEEIPISTSCMHCPDAPCVDVCPVDIIEKREEDGIVVHERDECIFCFQCGEACPYDAPTYPEDEQLMAKCNFCLGEGPGSAYGQPEKQKESDGGKKPSCVDNCVGGAIQAGPVDEMLELASAEAVQRYEDGAQNQRVIVEPMRKGTTDVDTLIESAVSED